MNKYNLCKYIILVKDNFFNTIKIINILLIELYISLYFYFDIQDITFVQRHNISR